MKIAAGFDSDLLIALSISMLLEAAIYTALREHIAFKIVFILSNISINGLVLQLI